MGTPRRIMLRGASHSHDRDGLRPRYSHIWAYATGNLPLEYVRALAESFSTQERSAVALLENGTDIYVAETPFARWASHRR